MNSTILITLTIILSGFSVSEANEETHQKLFNEPKHAGILYLASTADEVIGVERIQKKRAQNFCLSNDFDGVSEFKVKAISTVEYINPQSGERPYFKRLAPVELASFENGALVINDYQTKHNVLSSYRDPIYFKKIICFKN